MDHIIPDILESETIPERFFWDRIIRAVTTLSELSDEVDLFETLQDLKDESDEDAVNLLYSYTTMIEVPEGEELMSEFGLIELDDDIE